VGVEIWTSLCPPDPKIPPPEDSRPPSSRARNSLPSAGDKPGQKGVFSVTVGVGFLGVVALSLSHKITIFQQDIYASRQIQTLP
jgi:hypothetical protein